MRYVLCGRWGCAWPSLSRLESWRTTVGLLVHPVPVVAWVNFSFPLSDPQRRAPGMAPRLGAVITVDGACAQHAAAGPARVTSAAVVAFKEGQAQGVSPLEGWVPSCPHVTTVNMRPTPCERDHGYFERALLSSVMTHAMCYTQLLS